MEPFKPNQDNAKPEKRSIISYWRNKLAPERFTSKGTEDDDDDEEDEDNPKAKSRFRQLGELIFAKDRKDREEYETKKRPSLMETLAALSEKTKAEADLASVEAAEIETGEESEAESAEYKGELVVNHEPAEITEPALAELNEPPAVEPVRAESAADSPEPATEDSAESEMEEITTDEAETVPSPSPEPEAPAGPGGVPPEIYLRPPVAEDPDHGRAGDTSGLVFDRHVTSGSTNPEVIVERRTGGALAAFAGAEILSRRRDRKIRKDLRGVQQKQQTDRENQAQVNAQLEQLARQSQEQETLMKLQQRSFEAKLDAQSNAYARRQEVEAAEKRRVATPEKVQPAFQNKLETAPKPFRPMAEKLSPPRPNFERMPPPRVETVAQREILPNKAESIIEKVVEAAGHDQAIEREYERRHEIKDNQAPAPAGGMTPIGSILGGAPVRPPMPSGPVTMTSPTPQQWLDPSQPVPPPPSVLDNNRQAVQTGFWTGLFVAAVIIFLQLFG